MTGVLSVAQRYQPFFDSIGLDPVARAQVIAAIEAHEASFRDTMRNARYGITSEQTAAGTQLAEQYRQQITDLLGPDGAKALEHYGNIQMFVPVAEEFANRCAAAGVPLSDNLVSSIAENYAQNLPYPDYVTPTPEMAKTNERMNAQRETRAIEAAQKVLTPQQLDIFRRYWAERPYPEKQ